MSRGVLAAPSAGMPAWPLLLLPLALPPLLLLPPPLPLPPPRLLLLPLMLLEQCACTRCRAEDGRRRSRACDSGAKDTHA